MLLDFDRKLCFIADNQRLDELNLNYTKMFLLSSFSFDIKTDSIFINFVIVKFLVIRIELKEARIKGWSKIQYFIDLRNKIFQIVVPI